MSGYDGGAAGAATLDDPRIVKVYNVGREAYGIDMSGRHWQLVPYMDANGRILTDRLLAREVVIEFARAVGGKP